MYTPAHACFSDSSSWRVSSIDLATRCALLNSATVFSAPSTPDMAGVRHWIVLKTSGKMSARETRGKPSAAPSETSSAVDLSQGRVRLLVERHPADVQHGDVHHRRPHLAGITAG